MKLINEDLLKKLHAIADSEITLYRSIKDGEAAGNAFCEFLIEINSDGLVSEETFNEAVMRYNSDEDFRRLMGSISSNFALFVDPEELYEELQATLVPESLRFTSRTDPQISAHRVAFQGNQQGFGAFGDWWYVTLILMRLSLHYSSVVRAFAHKTYEASLAPTKDRNKPKPQTMTPVTGARPS